jgi:uncharacterized protein with GYD domain
MALFMYNVAYSPEGWAAQFNSPQNRIEAVRPAVEKLGGKIISAWYTFGEYDLIAVSEMPDNASAAAFAVAAAAGGAVKAIKTTPLMSIEEGMEAVKRAGGAGYSPPR